MALEMEMVRDCGFVSFLLIALGVLAAVIGLVALALGFVKPRWGAILGALALALSCSVPGVGALGTVHGRSITDGAVSGASITPEQRERIRAAGYAEAATCTTLGGGIGALPILLALGALGLGFARRKRQ
jgi:hypothetical protein